MIPWLEADTPFPSLSRALEDPNGLLAAGADLSVDRLLAAYQQGIFPWFSPGQPILWWSPDPRMVLFPQEMKISRSLAKTLAQGRYEIRLDSAFARVIAACANTPRPGQDGTWITRSIAEAYTRLHELGLAHSVETWVEGELVGGLYGVALGRMFYGESMFSHRTDASKIAFAHLVRYLQQRAYGMIDCQMRTHHLASLGAREIPRQEFIQRLQSLTREEAAGGKWPVHDASLLWRRKGGS